jgi:uncharacterized protein with GYD domain
MLPCMASYIVLIHFTEQGLKNIKDSPKRAAKATAMAKKMGVKIREIFWTLGAYDGVLILESPDEETITAWSLSMGALGFVKTETLRAFPAKKFGAILDKMD